MTTGIIFVLFIIQLITIFFIILLNGRISKFKDLEIRQNQLIREMDDAISLYLLEMKEENDRLISELQQMKSTVKVTQVTTPPTIKEVELSQVEQLVKMEKQQESQRTDELKNLEKRQFVPKTTATNAYIKQKSQLAVNPLEMEHEHQPMDEEMIEKTPPKERTYEEQVIAYYNEGKSIENIAKIMNKGKTEIELLIKFHV